MDLLSKRPVDEPNIDDFDSLDWFEAMNDSGKRQAQERNHPGKRAYEKDVFEVEEANIQKEINNQEDDEFEF